MRARGYSSSGRPASEFRPPPAGPAPGGRPIRPDPGLSERNPNRPLAWWERLADWLDQKLWRS